MEKVDAALVGWLELHKGSELNGVTIVSTFEDDTKDEDGVRQEVNYPFVAIVTADAPEFESEAEDSDGSLGTGNYTVDSAVIVATNAAEDSRDVHRRRAGIVAGILFRTDVASGIAAMAAKPAAFTLDQFVRGPTSRSVEGDIIMTTFETTSWCRAT